MGGGSSINSNIASLKAQRQLWQADRELRKTFERLSSGLRIVRASDDAAGLSIASALNNDRRVYTQGIRNLNDGVSYLNIADSAVDQFKSIAIRCRELVTQAASGTMTDSQRIALDQEAQALSREYNRILAASEFNGSRVFDAANAAASVQCGYGSREAIWAQTGEGVLTSQVARTSTTSAGAEATGGLSNWSSLNADGRFVTFESQATNLVTGDTNGMRDIFVKDLQTGSTQRVSTTSTGGEAGGGFSWRPSISADGRYIAFASDATNLVTGDTNGATDIFVKDLQTGLTQRVSASSAGSEAAADSYEASISADGRYIAFSSYASNLISGDTNGQWDIFVKDVQTGSVRRVSTTSTGGESTGGTSWAPRLSADGRYVAFESTATDLVAGDTNGQSDVFVKDLETGSIQRASTTSAGGQATGGASAWISISADGRYVSFESTATNLAAGDTNGLKDVFVKDLQTGAIQRVSVTAIGGQASGGDSYKTFLSADGRYVAFGSEATNLVSGDTNGRCDVFIRDLQTGNIHRVSTTSTGGEVTGDSFFPSLSADGRYAAFGSDATNLAAGDTNATYDIFVANNTVQSSAAGFNSVIRPLLGIYLKDPSLARMAQSTLDDYLDELNVAAGLIGSSISRFSVAISTLGVRTENIAAAASRITDVDVGEESSELTRRNILQQSASAVLAQANQQSAIALSLLRS